MAEERNKLSHRRREHHDNLLKLWGEKDPEKHLRVHVFALAARVGGAGVVVVLVQQRHAIHDSEDGADEHGAEHQQGGSC